MIHLPKFHLQDLPNLFRRMTMLIVKFVLYCCTNPFQKVQLSTVWRQIEDPYVSLPYFISNLHDTLTNMQMIVHIKYNYFRNF